MKSLPQDTPAGVLKCGCLGCRNKHAVSWLIALGVAIGIISLAAAAIKLAHDRMVKAHVIEVVKR